MGTSIQAYWGSFVWELYFQGEKMSETRTIVTGAEIVIELAERKILVKINEQTVDNKTEWYLDKKGYLKTFTYTYGTFSTKFRSAKMAARKIISQAKNYNGTIRFRVEGTPEVANKFLCEILLSD